MTKKWSDCLLGDFVTLKRGYDLPHDKRRMGNVPIVSSSGISGSHNEVKVKGPGVVTGRYGTLGEVFFIKEDFWPLNTTLYVQNFKGNDPRFVSYFLKTLNFERQNVAGAVPGVNRNVLHMMSVHVPPLPIQRKIAAILFAYDDLIENNTRRIKILEEMAQALYREWFVHFRFPGHEKVRMVDSPLGRIPEGWEVKKLGDIAQEIRRGVIPDEIDPETPYFGLELEKLKPQERGYEFEKLLFDLFDIYGFNPRPSFRNTGEQIDGSIEFEHQFYLIEAKWQTNPILEKDLLALHGRASGHSRIGRGIFITRGNFSSDGVQAFQKLQPTSIIGFDGQDLYLIFERCLPLADVIRLKVRKLVESGEFHYPVLKLIPEIMNAKSQ